MEKTYGKTDVENSGVHLLQKMSGETPNECILRFKNENPEYQNESMTYAGRLDPLAEGLLLVLSGGELQNKEKYLGLDKTYEFEILWGFSTDTSDILGVVLGQSDKTPNELEIRKLLVASVGEFNQSYPVYSSKPVNGKPLFKWAREGKIGEIEIPKHKVEIFNVDYVGRRRKISKKELFTDIVLRISKVSGDFRQEEILNKWREVLEKNNGPEFYVDKFLAKVSSGFYVRQFASDFAQKLNGEALAFYIKRTEVGDYKI